MNRKLIWAATGLVLAGITGVAVLTAGPSQGPALIAGDQPVTEDQVRKKLQSDRVVLEPGPVEEVETVRRMFAMFVHEGKHQREIAAILAQTDAPSPGSSQPSRCT